MIYAKAFGIIVSFFSILSNFATEYIKVWKVERYQMSLNKNEIRFIIWKIVSSFGG